jgi:hypothetical protein
MSANELPEQAKRIVEIDTRVLTLDDPPVSIKQKQVVVSKCCQRTRRADKAVHRNDRRRKRKWLKSRGGAPN